MTESRNVLIPVKVRSKAEKAIDVARGSQGRSGFISDLIERHVPGAAPDAEEAVAAPAPAAEPEPVVDLMAALRDSVEQARARARAKEKEKERREPDAEVVPVARPTRKRKSKAPTAADPQVVASSEPEPSTRSGCPPHPKEKRRVLSWGAFCGQCGERV